jgi:hypothetical protein
MAAYNLISKVISAAETTTTTSEVDVPRSFSSALIKATLTVATGGTSIEAWVQCSADQGATFHDVADFAFTTTAASLYYNLSGLTAVTTETAATDGALAANTSKDGLLTNLFRVKYVTVGTYTGSTTLAIWIFTRDND